MQVCGTRQSYSVHRRRCTNLAAFEAGGAVVELGMHDGGARLDKVIMARSVAAEEAYYRLVLHVLCNPHFDHNRSVRVIAREPGVWRVRRRRVDGWEWERIVDSTKVVDEVSAVMRAILEDIACRREDFVARAKEVMAVAERSDHSTRLLRVLRERRLPGHVIDGRIQLDDDEIIESSTRREVVDLPALPKPPQVLKCPLCDGSFDDAELMFFHLYQRCPERFAWAEAGSVHELSEAKHTQHLLCSGRAYSTDPFKAAFLIDKSFHSVRAPDDNSSILYVRVHQGGDWLWAITDQVPEIISRMRAIVRGVVGEEDSRTDAQLLKLIADSTGDLVSQCLSL
jgi:hypothetical protein